MADSAGSCLNQKFQTHQPHKRMSQGLAMNLLVSYVHTQAHGVPGPSASLEHPGWGEKLRSPRFHKDLPAVTWKMT